MKEKIKMMKTIGVIKRNIYEQKNNKNTTPEGSTGIEPDQIK